MFNLQSYYDILKGMFIMQQIWYNNAYASGSGSLIGGYVISLIGSTSLTFRYFGVAAAVAGLLLFFYEFGYRKGCKVVFHSNAKETKRKSEHLQHKQDNAILISEPLIKSKNVSIVKAKSNDDCP